MTDSNPPQPPKKVDPNLNDGFFAYWSNVFNIYTGRMTEEGREKLRITKNTRNEASDCKRCEDNRDWLFNYSPIIRFMRENINKLGGDLNSTNVRCRSCKFGPRQEAGFDPDYGIIICANEIYNRKHLEDVMAHEMIHAYDHLRFELDWHNNMRHAACAEIRASSLSGECRWGREFFLRLNFKLPMQHQECVKRRAVASLKARANVKDEAMARSLVDEVWDSCFADTRPFDEIYR